MTGIVSLGVGIRISATGTTASEIRIPTTMKSVASSGSSNPRSSGPSPSPIVTTSMYAESSRPRVSFVARSFSQLSIVTYRPDIDRPNTKRSTPHDSGSIRREYDSAVAAASDVSPANTLM
ncbi:hypothetical protein MNBD_ACTINO01-2368 [hydrothermal vent metagenome]|uniref:Uncharacterized protein n=1 Tax=hydrothermal vent metagenome TaxID=652676 RepID=A0A3B0SJC7_9ZZZZ